MKINKQYRLFLVIIIITTIISISGCTWGGGLPDPQIPEASRVIDSNGQLVTTIGEENRIPVKLNEISPFMIQAIVAVEDARFYNHPGIDPVGLIRAAYVNLRARQVVEGGSTLTQQLAKNLYLTHERTLARKIKEMYYAVQLERHFTKDEILVQYLNTVYFGKGAYGVEAAARTFYQKNAIDLTLAESAMLAGFVRAPGIYPEPGNFQIARDRQLLVLSRMVEVEHISEEERQLATEEDVEFEPNPLTSRRAAYFVAELIEQLSNVVPGGREALYTQGLQIETTLDLNMQLAAEAAVRQVLEERDEELQGALVALNPTNGYITAMVGGRDYGQTQFNRALANRQPGSAFKPFVYATGLEQGLNAASIFVCEPVEFRLPHGEPYRPTDYNVQFHNRPFTLKEALKISDNVVAVRAIERIGPRAVADLARRLGVESQLDPVLSLALGTSIVTPLEMARAYGVFANGGIMTKPIYYTRVLDREGRVLATQRTQLNRVLDERHAYIITDMMKSVMEPGGTGSHLAGIINRPAAGKTGTTDNYHDSWFVGYTPNIVAAIYVGYDQEEEEGVQRRVGTGGQVAGPIWAQFISRALENTPARDFNVPRGVVLRDVCTRDGLLATPASTGVITIAFVEGTEPVAACRGDWGWRLPTEEQVPELEDEPDIDNQLELGFPWRLIPRGAGLRFFNVD